MAGLSASDEGGRTDMTAAGLAYARRASRIAVWLGGGALILVSMLVTLEVSCGMYS